MANLVLRAALVAALLFAAPGAWAQAVTQAGPPVGGHAPMYVPGSGSSFAQVMDSGYASGLSAAGTQTGAGFSETLQINRGMPGSGTGPLGTHNCEYSAPVGSAGGANYLCFDANANGNTLIATGAIGTAAPIPCLFSINGVESPCIGNGSGNVIGPTNPVPAMGDLALWAGASTAVTDGGQAITYWQPASCSAAVDVAFQAADVRAKAHNAVLVVSAPAFGPNPCNVNLGQAYAMMSPVIFTGGAIMKPASGIQITLNGSPPTNNTDQMFDVTAASGGVWPIKISGKDIIDRPDWFGQTGKGNDDWLALNAAANAPAGDFTMKFAPGEIYNVCNSPLWMPQTGNHNYKLDFGAGMYNGYYPSSTGRLQVLPGCTTGIVAALYESNSGNTSPLIEGGAISGSGVAPHAAMLAQTKFPHINNMLFTGAIGQDGQVMTQAIPAFTGRQGFGTGYVVGDVVSPVGGTCSQTPKLVVSAIDSNNAPDSLGTVSAGVGQIRAVEILGSSPGYCATPPTEGQAINVSGGSGTGGKVIVAFGKSVYFWPWIPGSGYSIGETCHVTPPHTSDNGMIANITGIDPFGGVTAMTVNNVGTAADPNGGEAQLLTSCSAGGSGGQVLGGYFSSASFAIGNAQFVGGSVSAPIIDSNVRMDTSESFYPTPASVPTYGYEAYSGDGRYGAFQISGGRIAGVLCGDSGGDRFYGTHPFPSTAGAGGSPPGIQMFSFILTGVCSVFGGQADAASVAGVYAIKVDTDGPSINDMLIGPTTGGIGAGNYIANIVLDSGLTNAIVTNNRVSQFQLTSNQVDVLQLGLASQTSIVQNNGPDNTTPVSPTWATQDFVNTHIEFWTGGSFDIRPFARITNVKPTGNLTAFLPDNPIAPWPGEKNMVVYDSTVTGHTITIQASGSAQTINQGSGVIQLTAPGQFVDCILNDSLSSPPNWECKTGP
jgi:hypothetical protein